MAKSRKSKYTAGFHFVISTPDQTPDKKARKAVRSHAARASPPDRQTLQLRSWLSPNDVLGSLKKALLEEAPSPESVSAKSSLRRVGSDLSGLRLPSTVEPYMIQDLVKLIHLSQHGVYPYEICFDVHIVDRGWFPYMISDICCLHSMMFSVRAFLEDSSHDQLGPSARFHYAQTLQLLQARLNDVDKTSALSDATIMVVVTLAAAAELTGYFVAVKNHIAGLEKIVSLRGGVRALTTYNNLHVKVCRADLASAILSGHRPCLLKEDISWDPFIADRDLIHCSHQPYDTDLCTSLEAILDTKLLNILRDLHTFACISNLAYETTSKLSPEIYNEILISSLYRLTHLSFETDPVQESVRTGLMAFSSAFYLQPSFMAHAYDNLFNTYSNALFSLYKSPDIDLPVSIILWLTMLLHLVAHQEPCSGDWQSVWFDETITQGGLNSWSQVRETLRSFMWIGFIHDRPGQKFFEAAMLRIQTRA